MDDPRKSSCRPDFVYQSVMAPQKSPEQRQPRNRKPKDIKNASAMPDQKTPTSKYHACPTDTSMYPTSRESQNRQAALSIDVVQLRPLQFDTAVHIT
jgi:hypothetical protein